MRVVLADRDERRVTALELALRAHGFAVDVTDHGGDAIALARDFDPDALILADGELVGMPSETVIRELRLIRCDVPILVLCARPRPDVVGLLAAGADHAAPLPVHRDEILARVRGLVRRYRRAGGSDVLACGPITLDIADRVARVDGRPVPLTGKEHDLLEALMMRKGLVVGKEALLERLYGGLDTPEIKIIDVFLCKLRNKLRAARAGADLHLETVWGRGYKVVETPRVAPARQAQRAVA